MNIRKMNQKEMYEYLKTLSVDEQIKIAEEIQANLENIDKEDIIFLYRFNNVLERLTEDIINREKFYFELYNLIDDEGLLTPLGKYYEYIFGHHYIKAFRQYISFEENWKEKNKMFKTNEKAIEYLEHFSNHVKGKSKAIKR